MNSDKVTGYLKNLTNWKDRSFLDIVLWREKEVEFAINIGNFINFEHDLSLSDTTFVVDSIFVYESIVNNKTYSETEYLLKGQVLGQPLKYLKLRIDCDGKMQVMQLYDEIVYDQTFHDYLANDTFQVNQDDEGNVLAESREYWRFGDAVDPYFCNVTVYGKEGVEYRDVWFWDFYRIIDAENTEYLNVYLDDETKYFMLYKGRDIAAFQVKVINS